MVEPLVCKSQQVILVYEAPSVLDCRPRGTQNLRRRLSGKWTLFWVKCNSSIFPRFKGKYVL